MTGGFRGTRFIKEMIALEVVCLLLVSWPSYMTLTWYGPENYGLLALFFIGGPALVVQVVAMVIALVRTSRHDCDDPAKGQFQWWAVTPVALSIALIGWVCVAEIA